jgi:cobalt-zinc-cadmium efflux system outer membrane protein
LAGTLAISSLLPAPAQSESLTLDSCIVRALAANPGLRAASREVEAANARQRRAGALEPPSLELEAGKLGTTVGRGEHDAALRLSQEFGAPGARGRSKDVARAEAAIALANRESAALRLRGDVTHAYRKLQADELGVRTLESLRRTALDLEQMVNTRLRTGGARYLDVLRARSERVRIENDVVEADRTLREGRRALNALMARAPEAPLVAADSLVFVPLADSLGPALRTALATRPRLRAARLEVERGEAEVARSRGERWPSTTLSAGLDRVPGSDRPGVGGAVAFSLPFLPWTDRRAGIDEAHATRSGAQARLETAEREVESALRNAYASARSAERQVLQFDRVLLADASDAIRTAIQNYQAGQIDGLELFETLRTYRSIELEYIRALLNYEIALTDLAVAE